MSKSLNLTSHMSKSYASGVASSNLTENVAERKELSESSYNKRQPVE